MQVANTLAYYDTAIITAVKSFIVQAPELITAVKNFIFEVCSLEGRSKVYFQFFYVSYPDVHIIKLFSRHISVRKNKLECWALVKNFVRGKSPGPNVARLYSCNQGDQIGRNFAIWAFFYGVGQIFFLEKVAQ